jgi:SAM-dependent methyltransferase
MAKAASEIDRAYERFYAQRPAARVYPTEFVVRTFLASYPGLGFRKLAAGSEVLDVAVGDGRNTAFLCDQGYRVSGTEITADIVQQARSRLTELGHTADLRVGRNSALPFEASAFDCILACHCCYYCDEGESFADNMREYARVLRRGGQLVASLASADSYIFRGATALPDGSLRILHDPYGNRNGYRLQAFGDRAGVERTLNPWFHGFSFGFAANDYYGVDERVYWVTCSKR